MAPGALGVAGSERVVIGCTGYCGGYFVDRPAHVACVADFFEQALGEETGH